MNTLMRSAFLVALFSGNVVRPWFKFDDLDEHFKKMEEQIKNMRQEMHDGMKKSIQAPCASWYIEHQDSSSDSSLIITVSQVYTNDINAIVGDDDNSIRVVMDDGVVMIKTRNNWITLTSEQRAQHEKQDKDQSRSCSSVQSSSTSWTTHKNLNVSQTKVEYSSAQKIVTITIPYTDKKSKERKLPVLMQ